jgi:hypothetical protein
MWYFMDPYQDNSDIISSLSHPITKAYVELIDRETAHTYLQSIYYKVKQ